MIQLWKIIVVNLILHKVVIHETDSSQPEQLSKHPAQDEKYMTVQSSGSPSIGNKLSIALAVAKTINIWKEMNTN